LAKNKGILDVGFSVDARPLDLIEHMPKTLSDDLGDILNVEKLGALQALFVQMKTN